MTHPNAVVAGASGLGGGAGLVTLLTSNGVHLAPLAIVVITAGFSTVTVLLGKAGAIVAKQGLLGLWDVLRNGSAAPTSKKA